MKKGDRIIWDSGFGYEIGIYESDKGVMYNTCLVQLMSGDVKHNTPVSVPINDVHAYSKTRVALLTIKYGYIKSFKDD